MENMTVVQFIGICLILYGYYKLIEKFTPNELNHKKDTSKHA